MQSKIEQLERFNNVLAEREKEMRAEMDSMRTQMQVMHQYNLQRLLVVHEARIRDRAESVATLEHHSCIQALTFEQQQLVNKKLDEVIHMLTSGTEISDGMMQSIMNSFGNIVGSTEVSIISSTRASSSSVNISSLQLPHVASHAPNSNVTTASQGNMSSDQVEVGSKRPASGGCEGEPSKRARTE